MRCKESNTTWLVSIKLPSYHTSFMVSRLLCCSDYAHLLSCNQESWSCCGVHTSWLIGNTPELPPVKTGCYRCLWGFCVMCKRMFLKQRCKRCRVDTRVRTKWGRTSTSWTSKEQINTEWRSCCFNWNNWKTLEARLHVIFPGSPVAPLLNMHKPLWKKSEFHTASVNPE